MVKISNQEYNNLNNKIRTLKATLAEKEKQIFQLSNKVNTFDVLIVATSEPKTHRDINEVETKIVNKFKVKAITKQLIRQGFDHFKFFQNTWRNRS